jgi:hypothetical protein
MRCKNEKEKFVSEDKYIRGEKDVERMENRHEKKQGSWYKYEPDK